ncbi:Pupal cuticle protein [Eumeta japonica]|uniref:Pupal cuticle protein n=1 Tax=Eumeta variegata TaxID=151549 RepID=A0A4C1ZP48_EUMVA|nr:Pupal cuticle protein [Eumeta japonica]
MLYPKPFCGDGKCEMRVVLVAVVVAQARASGWTGPPANIALSQDGRNILDTPEVAHARAAHLAALQQAASNNPNPHDDGSYDPRWDNEEYWQQAEQPKWNAAPQWNAPAPQWNAPAPQWNAAPAHAPAWNAAGPAPAPVAETPEVAQARAAHLAALASAKSAAGPAHQQWNAPAQHQQWNAPQQWNGAPSWQGAPAHQPANIRLSHDGSQVLETPEVAAARAAHLAAHAQAAHAAPANPHQQHW